MALKIGDQIIGVMAGDVLVSDALRGCEHSTTILCGSGNVSGRLREFLLSGHRAVLYRDSCKLSTIRRVVVVPGRRAGKVARTLNSMAAVSDPDKRIAFEIGNVRAGKRGVEII